MKSKGLLVILGIIIILFFWGCNQQRALVAADQNVQTAWSNVETNYQRRMDLYNSVVQTIQGSANFEKSTLTEVINARAKATSVHVEIASLVSITSVVSSALLGVVRTIIPKLGKRTLKYNR